MELTVYEHSDIAQYQKRYQDAELDTITREIYEISMRNKSNSYQVCYYIAEVDKKQCYKSDGFESAADWAYDAFGIKKSQMYTMRKIGAEYTHIEVLPDGTVRYESNIPHVSGHDYSITQLEKMLPLKRAQINDAIANGLISVDMSCKDIGQRVKNIRKMLKLEASNSKALESKDAESSASESKDAESSASESKDVESSASESSTSESKDVYLGTLLKVMTPEKLAEKMVSDLKRTMDILPGERVTIVHNGITYNIPQCILNAYEVCMVI